MKKIVWLRLLIIGSAVLFQTPTALFCAEQDSSVPAGKRHEQAVFNVLLPIVYSSGKSVRLYYRGECSSKEAPVPFPTVKVKAATKARSGLAAIREMFENDKNVKVTEDKRDIIRIWIGKVSTEILQTKLPKLTLSEIDTYNPHRVFEAIMGAREFRAAEDSLGFTEPIRLGGTLQGADVRFPHVPSTLQSMSAERVLDLVAKTWAGRIVIVYGACDKPRKADNGRMFVMKWEGQVAWPSDLDRHR